MTNGTRARACGWLLIAVLAQGCKSDEVGEDGGASKPDAGDRDAEVMGDGGDADVPPMSDPDGGDEPDDEDGGVFSCSTKADCQPATGCFHAEECVQGLCVPARSKCSAVHPCLPDQSACDCAVPDADGDGEPDEVCGGTDCNDQDPGIFKGAIEVCDAFGRDEDCDPTTFSAPPRPGGPLDGDRDGDGFVSAECWNFDGESGRVYRGDDCDDRNSLTHPGALEICDYDDNDCDGKVDEGRNEDGGPIVPFGLREPFYPDADRDGCGAEGAEPRMECGSWPGVGYVRGREPCDCDDTDPRVNRNQLELCDGVDNDCNGLVDADDPDLLKVVQFTSTVVECLPREDDPTLSSWIITECPADRLWCADVIDYGCTTDATQLSTCRECETDCKFACGQGGCDEIAQLALGRHHSCAITAEGQATCWGRGAEGRLGTDLLRSETVATEVLGGLDTSTVGAGPAGGCAALGEERALYCWGVNASGQLASFEVEDFSTLPLPVFSPFDEPALAEVVSIDVGEDHSCAVRASGELLCWGLDTHGRLANGSPGDGWAQLPSVVYDVQYNEVDYAAAVAVGNRHACMLAQDGAVQCWGDNAVGQLGLGESVELAEVTQIVPGLGTSTQVAVGSHHSCALSDGEVYCWGLDDYGQLGRPGDTSVPLPVPGLTAVAAIALGDIFSCALDALGVVHCWGANHRGQCGEDAEGTVIAEPVVVPLPRPARVLAAGGGHACVIDIDGQVSCWGDNVYGQLGNGRSVHAPQPAATVLSPLRKR